MEPHLSACHGLGIVPGRSPPHVCWSCEGKFIIPILTHEKTKAKQFSEVPAAHREVVEPGLASDDGEVPVPKDRLLTVLGQSWA